MVFQLDDFLRMKKGLIVLNEMQTFLLISEELQLMWLVQLSEILFYRFLFFICQLEIF